MKHVILPFFEYFISLKSIRPVTTGHESSSGVKAIMSYYLMPGTCQWCHRHPFRSNTQTIDSKSLNAFSVHYTISDNDKAKINAVVPTKILAAALVWLYPQPEKWSYTVLQGALIFNLDKSDGARRTSFQVDRFGWSILWEHELYENLQYNSNNDFFHSFEGDVSCV